MSRAVVILVGALAMAAATARAEPESPTPTQDAVDAHVAKARELHDKGDFAGARAEILEAYTLDPRPELLFALGQLEFNLHHYPEAIAYYEQFEATRPDAEQAALAEQAIGAARAEMSRPPPAPPAPPKPPPHRQWDGIDTAIAAAGGLAIVASGALAFEAVHLSDETNGTLADYDHRIATARHVRIAAIATAGGGLALVGAALLRWQFHLVDSVEVQATPTSIAVAGAF